MNKIKKNRNKKGLTQIELAESVGITHVYLSYLENGHKEPSLSTLKKIAQVLQINVSELL